MPDDQSAVPGTPSDGQPPPDPGPGTTVSILYQRAMGRPLALLAFAAALLALVYLVPALAVPVVWPFLLLVPGWFLATRAAPGISPAGRTGIGIVASAYLSAHLVNLAGTLTVGVRVPVILGVTLLLMAATWALARLRLPFLAPPPVVGPRRAIQAMRLEPAPWLIAGTGVLVVGGVLGASIWHLSPGGWVSGGWNWSDFLVHISIGKSIAAGNFPPQVPYFAGVPLTYHWFADFHGALTALVAGIDIIPVYAISSALMAGALALVAWELARLLTDDGRVATLAAVFVLFTGGMGYLRLPIDLAAGGGSVTDLLSNTSYDNTWFGGWPYFRIPSVLGTGLLAHRATTFGLPGLVASVLLLAHSLGRRPSGVALAGVLAALLAPFQFFFFPATYLIVLLLVIARRTWREPTALRDAALFLAPLVLALPFVLSPVLQQAGSGAARLVLGWESAPLADGPLAVAFFYLTNLGIPFLLALVAALRRDLPSRWFLTAWLVALFLVPNLVQASAISFDMNKYFQVMWIAVAIMAAWLIARWPRPLIALILAFSVLSPALVSTWFVIGQPIVLTAGQERAARWIEANTPERTVFVTDDWVASPVDLAGRLRLTTFGPYVANLGYDPSQRAVDVQRIYCDGDTAAADLMRQYAADFVVSPGSGVDCGGSEHTPFGSSPLFESVYDADGVSIWRLRSG